MTIPNIDNTPIILSEEQTANIHRAMSDILSVTQMTWQYIQDNKLTKDTAKLMIKTIEHQLDDLSGPFEYQSAAQLENENRIKKIRTANLRIRELESQIGKSNADNPDIVTAGLKYFARIFQLWYKLSGFHYIRLEDVSEYGYMHYNISSEVETDIKDEKPDNPNDEIEILMRKYIKPQFEKDSPFDLIHDGYRTELLGTEKNQKLITELFKAYFPDCTIRQFTLHKNDYGSFSLRTDIILSLKDISNVLKILRAAESEEKTLANSHDASKTKHTLPDWIIKAITYDP